MRCSYEPTDIQKQCVLTPASPGIKPSSAKDGVQPRPERRVRLEVVRPRGHGLERVAHLVRGGARVRWDKGVNLKFIIIIIDFGRQLCLL